MIIIVNTVTGDKIRDVINDRAAWSSGAVTYGVKVGTQIGDERAVQVVYNETGSGALYTDGDGLWDEYDSWIVDRAWYEADTLPAGTTPPRLIASAFGVTPLPNDFDVLLNGPYNLLGGMYMDVGSYFLLFGTTQPDTGYFVLPSDGATRIATVEKGTDYILLQAMTQEETPIDPASFNIEVYRL